MRILIVEDDLTIAANISDFLKGENFAAETASNANDGLVLLETEDYDCLILDWMLPDKDGPSVIKHLRETNVAIPILLLTAKGQVEDKVAGIESGADDYLTKPFALSELLARVRALIRRKSARTPTPLVSVGNLSIDTNSQQVRVGNKPVSLSPKEYGILEYLALNLNMTVDRTDLLYHVWGEGADAFSNTIDVHVRFLRQKLGDKKNELIKTVKGKGYLLCRN